MGDGCDHWLDNPRGIGMNSQSVGTNKNNCSPTRQARWLGLLLCLLITVACRPISAIPPPRLIDEKLLFEIRGNPSWLLQQQATPDTLLPALNSVIWQEDGIYWRISGLDRSTGGDYTGATQRSQTHRAPTKNQRHGPPAFAASTPIPKWS
jgi:hypothetical protein